MSLMPARSLAGVATGCALALAGYEARADDPPPTAIHTSSERPVPFTVGPRPVWYWLGGVTTGASLVARDRGFFLGGETSVARLSNGGHFYGAYADAAYDFGAHRTSASLGPELGYKLVGVDAGLAARLGGDRVEWGASGRLFLTVGAVSLYGRYEYFFDTLRAHDENVVQVGALIKLPLAVWGLN